MSKVISVKLSTQSISKAIKEVEKYKEELIRKEKVFLQELAYLGVKEASIRFTSAIYDGVNDSTVDAFATDNGYRIEASGQAVAFIEFGSGVYHNSGDPYPNPRPAGIVGIGEYGQGKGKRRAWFYRGQPGSNGEVQPSGFVKTRGNPAAMPMWYATEEMRNSIIRIAREVFG